jgi:hypothetical protein
MLLFVNGRSRIIRGLALRDGPGHLPVWEADVDGANGCAGTLDAALILAARAAEMIDTQTPEES